MAHELHNTLLYHIHDGALLEFAKKHFKGRLIDIGCGTKPYAEMMKPLVKEHVGVDHEASLHDKSNVDLFGTAYSIPADDNSFDSALCTAVLEHLEEPFDAIQECRRVLKPGGIAIYSAPFIWHLHEEPRDFYRYSYFGLEYLFKKAEFEIIEIKPLSGFWFTFGQLFIYNLYRLNRGPLRWLRVIDVMGLSIQGFMYIMDKMDKTERWTWMYMVVARKK